MNSPTPASLIHQTASTPQRHLMTQIRRSLETVVCLPDATEPSIASIESPTRRPSRYEVFDRETQQTYAFPTDEAMQHWLSEQLDNCER